MNTWWQGRNDQTMVSQMRRIVSQCDDILRMSNLEHVIVKAVNKIRGKFKNNLSFYDNPISWSEWKTKENRRDVEALKNEVYEAMDEDSLALGITHYIDFLADQRTYIKDRISIKAYDNIALRLQMPDNPKWKEIAESASFWRKLEKRLTDLDNKKYKQGLEHSADVQAKFSKAAMEDLQNTFKGLQKKIERAYDLDPNEIPYNMGDRDKLFAFYKFTPAWNSTSGQALVQSDSVNDVATFVAKIGQEKFFYFCNTMCLVFKNPKVSAKTNVQRIAQKIEELMEENNAAASEAWQYLTDILRLSVYCDTPQQVKDTVAKILVPRGDAFQLVRFKPRFTNYLKDMIINFNLNGKAICEMQIKLGETPRGYGEQHFVYECKRTVKARSVGLLFDCITKQVNWCFHDQRMIYDTSIRETPAQSRSLQEVLQKEGHDIKNYSL